MTSFLTPDVCASGAVGELKKRLVGFHGLTLLNGDTRRLRLLINMHAQLRGAGVTDVLILAVSPSLCERLHHYAINTSCATCASGPFAHSAHAAHLATWGGHYSLDDKILGWFQRLYFIKLLAEQSVDVLAVREKASQHPTYSPLAHISRRVL